jgi:hypothetical protein
MHRRVAEALKESHPIYVRYRLFVTLILDLCSCLRVSDRPTHIWFVCRFEDSKVLQNTAIGICSTAPSSPYFWIRTSQIGVMKDVSFIHE